MANPTDVIVNDVATFEATSLKQTANLRPDLAYSLVHLGKKTDGTTADTSDIFYACDEDPTADYTAGVHRGKIIHGGAPKPIGPGVSELRFKTNDASKAPMFEIIPILKY